MNTDVVHSETYRGTTIVITQMPATSGEGWTRPPYLALTLNGKAAYRCPAGTLEQVVAKLHKQVDTEHADADLLPKLTQQVRLMQAGREHTGQGISPTAAIGGSYDGDAVGVHAMGKVRRGILTRTTRTKAEIAYTTASSNGRVFRKLVPFGEVFTYDEEPTGRELVAEVATGPTPEPSVPVNHPRQCTCPAAPTSPHPYADHSPTTEPEPAPAAPGPVMYNNRVLTPITAAVFDAQFPAELPTNFPDRGRGASDTARLELAGESYQLTRVHMPSGEVRRSARQYNGYCEGPTAEDTARSMRFGCAWSPVQVGGGQYRCAGDPSCTGHPRPLPVAEQCRPASTVPAIGSEVELADGHDAGSVGRVLATDGHQLGVDMRADEVLVTWRGGGSQVIRADRLRVTWSPTDNPMTVEQQDDAADSDADQYADPRDEIEMAAGESVRPGPAPAEHHHPAGFCTLATCQHGAGRAVAAIDPARAERVDENGEPISAETIACDHAEANAINAVLDRRVAAGWYVSWSSTTDAAQRIADGRAARNPNTCGRLCSAISSR